MNNVDSILFLSFFVSASKRAPYYPILVDVRLSLDTDYPKIFYSTVDQLPEYSKDFQHYGHHLGVVFQHADLQSYIYTVTERQLSVQKPSYWSNFQRNNDQKREGAPGWMEFTIQDSEEMYLNEATYYLGGSITRTKVIEEQDYFFEWLSPIEYCT